MKMGKNHLVSVFGLAEVAHRASERNKLLRYRKLNLKVFGRGERQKIR